MLHFGIKDQNLELKIGISGEKIYLVTTLTLSSDALTSLSLGVGGRNSVGSSKKESEKLKGCRQVQHVQRGTVRLLLLRPAHFQCALPRHSLQLSGFTFALMVLLQARQTS